MGTTTQGSGASGMGRMRGSSPLPGHGTAIYPMKTLCAMCDDRRGGSTSKPRNARSRNCVRPTRFFGWPARFSRRRNSTSEQLAEAGVEPSVGSKGDSYHNALLELSRSSIYYLPQPMPERAGPGNSGSGISDSLAQPTAAPQRRAVCLRIKRSSKSRPVVVRNDKGVWPDHRRQAGRRWGA